MSRSMPPYYVSIEEECRRNPQLKMSDLQKLEDWMDKQPHLPKTEMFYLIPFLHRNYYQIESTKRMIENFFTIRTRAPELFSNRNPIAWERLRIIMTSTGFIPLEQENEDGYFTIFGKYLDPNPNLFDHAEWTKYLFMACDVQNIIRGTNKGYIIVIDLELFSLGHIARVNLMCVKKIVFYLQEAAPMQLRGIHLINANSVTDVLLKLVKPLMNTEMWNLIHVHTSLETVKQFVPFRALPNESGGKAGSFKELIAKHTKLLNEFCEWFQYDELNRRVNESLRIGKFHTAENLFGVDGNFKKLDID